MIEKLKKNMGTDGKDRGTVKKIVALFFFGAIILVFVFMGETPGPMGTGSGGVVAQVNGTSISINQLRETIRRMEQRFGSSNSGLQEFLRGQAIETLINRELMSQEIEKEGLYVSDSELKDVIVNIPAFQDEGRFQRSFYENYLSATRQSHSKFEEELRKDIATQRLQASLYSALLPMGAEIAREREVAEKKTAIEYLQFTGDALIKEKAKSVSSFPQTADFTEQIKKFYEDNISEFSEEEQVRAQHILIKFKAGDSADEKRAKEKVDSIALRAAKEDFAKLAKEFSEDKGSQVKGGDLGYFGRGQMVAPFEKQAFSMNVGEVSAPVKSQFGFHLIKLLDKKAAKKKSFEDVKSLIGKRIQARELVEKDVANLNADLEKGNSSKANAFAKRYGLQWKSTSEFGLNVTSVPGIGENEDLLREAFKLNKSAKMAKQTFLVDGRTYVIRHKALQQAKDKTVLDEETISSTVKESSALGIMREIQTNWRAKAEVQMF